jgi:uncharacterized membrane protein YphA (DoxX/SURF4 family)
MTTKRSFWTDSDIGLLIIRITLGVTIFFHGWHKVLHGIEDQKGLIEAIGIPGFFMYFGYISEVLAPVLIILGIFTRLSAIAIIITQLFYLFIPIALLFTGPGRFTVFKSKSDNWLLG